jgi:aldehyde dehydrogenase (NAD+)
MEEIVNKLRKTFNTHETKSEKWRREQLLAIDRMLDEHKDDFCEAVKLDLNKPAHETLTAEIGLIKNSITFALKNLSAYIKPQKTTPIVQVRALYSTYVQ